MSGICGLCGGLGRMMRVSDRALVTCGYCNGIGKEGTQEADRVIDLLFAARRVWEKYGHDEKGAELDWTEWTDLRDAILAVRDGHLRPTTNPPKAP